MGSGTCILARCDSGASTNDDTGSSRRGRGGGDEERRVEAAGPVDAQNAPTRSLQNAQNAFRTAPTRVILVIESDKTVTQVAGQICYLGRRPGKLTTHNWVKESYTVVAALLGCASDASTRPSRSASRASAIAAKVASCVTRTTVVR